MSSDSWVHVGSGLVQLSSPASPPSLVVDVELELEELEPPVELELEELEPPVELEELEELELYPVSDPDVLPATPSVSPVSYERRS